MKNSLVRLTEDAVLDSVSRSDEILRLVLVMSGEVRFAWKEKIITREEYRAFLGLEQESV